MGNLSEAAPTERYAHLLSVMSSERFLKMEGLGNEVPFFICPYKPQEAQEMEQMARQLSKALSNKGLQVLLIDLYELSVEIIRERGIWEETLRVEPKVDKQQLLEHLQSILDPEHHLIPAIAARLAETESDILILCGVGAVYPYIRSHTILNNLQSTAKDLPTVLFFPGEYRHSSLQGSSLRLFGLVRDDNYYRAFDIYQFQQ